MEVHPLVALPIFLVWLAVINICSGNCIYDSSWCQNGGYCDYSEDRCICPHGFAGSRCETGNCIYDRSWCQNGGYCDDLGDRCICPPGFAGSRCETGVKYMLDECSRTLRLNSTDTLVLKSQSSKYMPAYGSCDLVLRAPSLDHQILVNIVEFKMHYDCDINYLQFDGGKRLCGEYLYPLQYVFPLDSTTMRLRLGSHDNHLGFMMTVSTFFPPDQYYHYCDFKCTNGRCISSSLYHNGFDDCGDGSDEPVKEPCYDDMHSCPDGRCIPKQYICDCNADCKDGADEWGCSCPQPAYGTCEANRFWCESTRTCIHNTLRCDGVTDCMNPSDESGCYPYTTPSSGNCIYDRSWCQNSGYCDYSEDRCICPHGFAGSRCEIENMECLEGTFRCENSYTCIPTDYVCDTYIDCTDGSDENNCQMGSGLLTGLVLASMLSVVCFVAITLLVVSIVLKRRRVRARRNNIIRTVSAYIPPEPQNLFTNCDIPPSYEIAVGIDGTDLVKEGLEEEQSVSPELKSANDFEDADDTSSYNFPDGSFDDCCELPLVDAVSEISKTEPPTYKP